MRRLMQQTTYAVLNAFHPSPAPVRPPGTPTHQDELHSTALIKLSQGTSILQHHTLKFVSSIFLAEPSTLEHIRAEGFWDLALGSAFFFWNARHDTRQQLPGEFVVDCVHICVDSSCSCCMLIVAVSTLGASLVCLCQQQVGFVCL